MKSKFTLLLICAIASLHAEVKVFKNFTLIDGTGRGAATERAMVVNNGRIAWVGPVAQLATPSGAEVIDFQSKYVMPGMIGLHVHLGITEGLTQDAKFFTPENVEKNLKTYASYGVTSVVSMGTDKDSIFSIRDRQRATGRPGETRVFTAGQGFVFKGGYGGVPGINQGISSIAEVEPAVAAQAAKHVDLIKLWMDDHLGTQKKMPYEMSKAIIESAHKHHLRVAAHIFYLEDARHLVEYGVDGLAHSVRDKPVDRDLISSMKRHGTWQMAATLSREASMFTYAQTPSFLKDPFFICCVTPEVIDTLSSSEYHKKIASDPHFKHYPEYLRTAQENLKKLVDSNVRYGFGTDAGPPGRFPGYFEHWELELMVQAGLTPAQSIAAATRNGAQFLGANELGTLEKAKWADMIILDRNPLEDIKNTRAIHAVYIAGNRVK
jgi:imidazolonepropionase-like amidohydrolase